MSRRIIAPQAPSAIADVLSDAVSDGVGRWERAGVASVIERLAWELGADDRVTTEPFVACEITAASEWDRKRGCPPYRGVAVRFRNADDDDLHRRLHDRITARRGLPAMFGGPGAFVRWWDRERDTTLQLSRAESVVTLELLAHSYSLYLEDHAFEWGSGNEVPWVWSVVLASYGGFVFPGGRILRSWDELAPHFVQAIADMVADIQLLEALLEGVSLLVDDGERRCSLSIEPGLLVVSDDDVRRELVGPSAEQVVAVASAAIERLRTVEPHTRLRARAWLYDATPAAPWEVEPSHEVGVAVGTTSTDDDTDAPTGDEARSDDTIDPHLDYEAEPVLEDEPDPASDPDLEDERGPADAFAAIAPAVLAGDYGAIAAAHVDHDDIVGDEDARLTVPPAEVDPDHVDPAAVLDAPDADAEVSASLTGSGVVAKQGERIWVSVVGLGITVDPTLF